MTARSDTPPLEREVKFRLSPGAANTLARHPWLQAGSSPEARHDVTTYYDTPSRALAHAGGSLRVRRRGGRRIQTLKLSGAAQGGVFARQEWEWPVESDTPDLQRLLETPLAPRLAELDELRPVFVTDVRRSVQVLQHGGATIELSLDNGRIRAGDATEPIHELELELIDGDPEPLYRLAAALHADVPMTLGTESKADRGWRLCTGQARAPAKQARLRLPREITAGAAFQSITGTALAHLLANEPATEAGEVEGVHQMRVAIRRLRTSLVLFQPLLQAHAEARFTEELRRLGQVFGEARDWDVFCSETLPAAQRDGLAAGWVELLRRSAEREHATAHARVGTELQGQALTGLTLGLTEWAGDPAAAAGDLTGNPMQPPLRAVAPKLLGRLARKVRRRGGHLGRRPQEELHALRKSLKKLRYSIEFLAPLGRQKRVKAYLRRCKALLKRLGASNDAVVAAALAERLADREAELLPAAAALAGWAAARQRQARRKLRRDWRKFDRLPLPV